jgi:hypothetical protein
MKMHYFLANISLMESNFHSNGVGINEMSGLTYDGTTIDYDTGRPHPGGLHAFTASSKESLHLNLLARALEGNSYAQMFINNGVAGESAIARALLILERKISSYEKFNQQYPGFGGYLPWFRVTDEGISLLPEWSDSTPALDNGQLLWAMMAVQKVLEPKSPELARRYKQWVQLMQHSSIPMFYDGGGIIRAVSKIRDIKAQPTPENYYNAIASYYLDDPYEGELFAFFMDLYSPWELFNYTKAEREKIWEYKRKKLRNVSLKINATASITVEEGYWHSSHEKWKYLVLPYTDVPINRRIFLNGERARTWYSCMQGIPGLLASVSQVTPKGLYNYTYISACGIQPIASQPVHYTTTLTTYGAFPVVLADANVGLAWYLNMLQGPRMQGPLGATESVNSTGTVICPVVTWDSKIPTLVAAIGGVTDITAAIMKQDGVYDRFYKIIDQEWSRVFPTLHGEDLPLCVPRKQIPVDALSDFTTCTA